MKSCALILADDRLAMTMAAELASVVALELSLNEFDARHQIRRGAGMLARKLPEDRARRIADALLRLGYGCFAVPEDALRPVPRARRVSRLEFTDDGLKCLIGYRWLDPIPWSELTTVHAYAFARRVDDKQAETRRGRGVSVAGITRLSDHARNIQWNVSSWEDRHSNVRVGLYADLICLGRDALLRIEHDAFQFDCLPERSTNSTENFVHLLALLKERIPAENLPSRTELMSREATDIELYLFDKVEERENATLWLHQRFSMGVLWDELEFPSQVEDWDDDEEIDADEIEEVEDDDEAVDIDDDEVEDIDDDDIEDVDDGELEDVDDAEVEDVDDSDITEADLAAAEAADAAEDEVAEMVLFEDAAPSGERWDSSEILAEAAEVDKLDAELDAVAEDDDDDDDDVESAMSLLDSNRASAAALNARTAAWKLEDILAQSEDLDIDDDEEDEAEAEDDDAKAAEADDTKAAEADDAKTEGDDAKAAEAKTEGDEAEAAEADDARGEGAKPESDDAKAAEAETEGDDAKAAEAKAAEADDAKAESQGDEAKAAEADDAKAESQGEEVRADGEGDQGADAKSESDSEETATGGMEALAKLAEQAPSSAGDEDASGGEADGGAEPSPEAETPDAEARAEGSA